MGAGATRAPARGVTDPSVGSGALFGVCWFGIQATFVCVAASVRVTATTNRGCGLNFPNRVGCRSRSEAVAVALVKATDSDRTFEFRSKPTRSSAGRSERAARLSRCSFASVLPSANLSAPFMLYNRTAKEPLPLTFVSLLTFIAFTASCPIPLLLPNVKDEPRWELA